MAIQDSGFRACRHLCFGIWALEVYRVSDESLGVYRGFRRLAFIGLWVLKVV